MADPRFFRLSGPYTLRQLAEIADAEIASAKDHEKVLSDVAPLESAGPQQVSFLDNKK